MKPGSLLRPAPERLGLYHISSVEIGNRPDILHLDYQTVMMCPHDGFMLFLGGVDITDGYDMRQVMCNGVVGWVSEEMVEVVDETR